MNIHISRPRFSAKRIVKFDCPDCKKNSRSIEFFQHWYGWHSTCIGCGRQWGGGEWVALPFARGVRKANIDAAKQLWRKLKGIGPEINMDELEIA